MFLSLLCEPYSLSQTNQSTIKSGFGTLGDYNVFKPNAPLMSRVIVQKRQIRSFAASIFLLSFAAGVQSEEVLPIADAHVHYSHDSVELTPPARVVEIMREAQLKFALVSSSDDRGTQLLSALAPDLIVPGLRPYTRRGQTGSWYTDQENLDYVEDLLRKNRYASIGEFHLFGDAANLDIPRRIVELAVEHNLILHAHSDAQAVEWLLKHDDTVKVIWAHAGFDEPEFVAEMLSKHDRLWVDLAFRGEVGSGGSLTSEWRNLFDTHPDRVMLGTDTYTPERMYYLPDHAESSRVWLNTLPKELAEKIAWKNAYDLIMPVWKANRSASAQQPTDLKTCQNVLDNGGVAALDEPLTVLQPVGAIEVSEPFDVIVTVCGDGAGATEVALDATMPAHGHGMNYAPEHTVINRTDSSVQVKVNGVRLHMPGTWQWSINLRKDGERLSGSHEFVL